jgi:hypothetical protein
MYPQKSLMNLTMTITGIAPAHSGVALKESALTYQRTRSNWTSATAASGMEHPIQEFRILMDSTAVILSP